MKIARLLFTSSLMLVLAACGTGHNGARFAAPQGNVAAAAVEGTYKAIDPEVSLFGPKTKEYLTIGTNSVRVATVCKSGGQKVIAEVTVPAVVTARHIEIQRSATQTVPLGKADCTARVEARAFDYDLVDGRLMLTPQNGTTYVYGQRVVPRPPAPDFFSGWNRPRSHTVSSAATSNALNYFVIYNLPYWSATRTSSSHSRATPGRSPVPRVRLGK